MWIHTIGPFGWSVHSDWADVLLAIYVTKLSRSKLDSIWITLLFPVHTCWTVCFCIKSIAQLDHGVYLSSLLCFACNTSKQNNERIYCNWLDCLDVVGTHSDVCKCLRFVMNLCLHRSFSDLLLFNAWVWLGLPIKKNRLTFILHGEVNQREE